MTDTGSITLATHDHALLGIQNMLCNCGFPDLAEVAFKVVTVETALHIARIARFARDEAGWFPAGKWATIQCIEERCDDAIRETIRHKEDHHA